MIGLALQKSYYGRGRKIRAVMGAGQMKRKAGIPAAVF
jgi:hypothetical protein